MKTSQLETVKNNLCIILKVKKRTFLSITTPNYKRETQPAPFDIDLCIFSLFMTNKLRESYSC